MRTPAKVMAKIAAKVPAAARRHSGDAQYDVPAQFATVESTIGNTPLVRLQRIPGPEAARRGVVVLAKLEGNNPGGSVKDRPALSMIRRAQERGQIKPGDRLIEATSGNTGIALAMIAAMRGLPDDADHAGQPVGRAARIDARLRSRADPDTGVQGRHGIRARPGAADAGARRGQGARSVRQPGQSARALRVHRARSCGATRAATDALRVQHGHDRHHHGRIALPEGEESPHPDRRRAASRRLAASRASASGRPSICRRSTTPRASIESNTYPSPTPRRWRLAWPPRRASSAEFPQAAPLRSRCAWSRKPSTP